MKNKGIKGHDTLISFELGITKLQQKIGSGGVWNYDQEENWRAWSYNEKEND